MTDTVVIHVSLRGDEARRWRQFAEPYNGSPLATIRSVLFPEEPKRAQKTRPAELSPEFRQCVQEGSVSLLSRLFKRSASHVSCWCRRHNIRPQPNRSPKSTPEQRAANEARNQAFLSKWRPIVAANPEKFLWELREE